MAPTTKTIDPLAEMTRKLAQLQAENDALKAAKAGAITVKVGPSGTLAVYGLGRMPISLYKAQWEAFLAKGLPMVQSFLADPAKAATLAQGKDDKRFEQSKAQAKAAYEAKQAGRAVGAAGTAAPNSGTNGL